jgi:uncharacterized membrane protein
MTTTPGTRASIPAHVGADPPAADQPARLRLLAGRTGSSALAIWILTRAALFATLAFGEELVTRDVHYYASSLRALFHGGSITTTLREYPLPVLAIMLPQYLASAMTVAAFVALFAASMLLVDGAFALVLWRAAGREGSAALTFWLWWIPAVGPLAFYRFDLVPAALAGIAVLAAVRRPAWSGAATAAGVALKLWPVLLLPAVLARRAGRGAALRWFAITGGAVAAGCVIVGGWSRLLSPLSWQSGRGLQVESVAALPLMLGRAIHHGPWRVRVSRFQSTEVFGPGTHGLLLASTVATALALAVLLRLWLSAFRRPALPVETIGWLVLTTSLLVIVSGKTLSPQYLLWLGGPLAVLILRAPRDVFVRRAAAGVLVACALTQLEYPLLYTYLINTGPSTFALTLLLAVRDGVLVWVTWLATRQSWRLTGAPELHAVRLVRRLAGTARAHLAISVVTAGCCVFYLAHSLGLQAAYLSNGYDLGIFDQAERAYAHLQAPMVPIKGAGYNIWGDHFHPIITLLAPFYRVWDNPGVLLVSQALLTAASIPVVYRFARRRAGAAISVIISAAYGAGWPLQALIDFDFHEIAFATPIAALAIDALDRRDDRKLLLWCALLLLVREDMGLLVALFGVLRLLQRRGNRRVVVALVLSGVGTYLLTTSLIIPQFADGHGFAYGNQFSALGSSVPAAAIGIFTHPWHAVAVFFTPWVKARTLGLLLVPLALLPLRSPYALLALPLLAERFFNSRQNLWQAIFHYNALPWLILVMAMIDGGQRFGLFAPGRRAKVLRRALAALLILTPAALVVIGPRLHVVPITQVHKKHPLFDNAWRRSAEATVAFLPRNVCVMADNNLVPHLTARDYTSVPQADTTQPDFYALDLSAKDTGGNPPAPKPLPVYADAVGRGFHVVFRSGPFVILRSADYTGPSSVCRPLGPGKSG